MKPSYNDLVFINCPFDIDYRNNFEAIVFSVYRCGFFPISALSEDNALDNRLSKIIRLIGKCRYGIHDISRIQLNPHGFPRFNMPFELGIFFGAIKFGERQQKQKNALVFEQTKFTYQEYISDLNGIDTKAHENSTENIIQHIRNWLNTSSRRRKIPGHVRIINEFEDFQVFLPDTAAKLNLLRTDLSFNDLCSLTEEYLKTYVS